MTSSPEPKHHAAKFKGVICLSNKNNEKLLLEFFDGAFEILLSGTESEISSDTDLCIFDDVTLKMRDRHIQQLRDAVKPLLLPVMVICTQENAEFLTNHLRQLCDEIVTMPIRKNTFQWKLEQLIVRRKNSLELKQLLRKSEEQVEALEMERGLRERIVDALTHDLRTPLSSAKMAAQLMHRKPEDVKNVKKFSDRITNSMDRADRMIRDLLDGSRIRAGEKLSIHFEECNFIEIIKRAIEELAMIHGNRFELHEEKPQIYGYWDQDSIRRIVENLASNGIKYGSEKTLIKINVEAPNDSVAVTVHNDGNPLSLDEQAKIFTPYHRTDSALTAGKKGWGIGLTLVKSLAEAHGGKISVVSSKEVGTSFTVTLPIDSRRFNA